MKRILWVVLGLCLLLGCGKQPESVQPPKQTTAPETTVPVTTIPETTVPETTVPETTLPEPTQPEHSDLYLPDISVDDVVCWFSEVCLNSEYLNYGSSDTIQKWTVPMEYYIHGEPTQEDLAKIDAFSQWLNTLDGFPGMIRTETPETANLQIHFTDAQGMVDLMGSNFEYADGGFTYWSDDFGQVYDSIICVRTDLDQHLRNSVLLEELYNCLGARQDTAMRPDSLIYQDFSTPQEMSEVDELIIKILYHPQICCGMKAEDCDPVIREIYY